MSVDYLRISVTDKCNLRCVYCNPLGSCGYVEHREILSFEEIHRIARLSVRCGIQSVRLTGGEPLVRRNIVHLVQKITATPGINEVTLTTNGVLLEPMAAELKAAGLSRINVSVDSAERECYQRITGFDLLEKVTRGIYRAIEVGLTPLKINAVILKGINESQVPALARISLYLPVAVRFIEYCPTSRHTRPSHDFIANSQVRKIIESRFGPLSAILGMGANGPALYFKVRNSAGTIGFISGRTSVFCRSCNRLRLTSDGKLRPCLYSAHQYDLKKLIRSGAGDKQIMALLERIIEEKHRYTKFNSFTEDFSMQKIGG
ncbi:MAG: GTP 3',8-cyclase MoaA [Planctomycetes bacterium]|nr:GTP 3',8-cyclase MoaA [Planctomycetota bacterium]